MKIDFKELKELELNNLGAWPFPMIIVLTLCVSLFILGLGYWFDIKRQFEVLAYVRNEEVTLKSSFERKVDKASNLSAYRAQMESMNKTFGGLLRQLPERTEVPALLEDISHQGLAAGLEFLSIRLQPEKVIDFYVELPIEISVVGTYHQFAEFVSNVAALPRIVTLHDFVIHSQAANDKVNAGDPNKVVKIADTDKLVMNITAKTYRYMAPDEKLPNAKLSHAPK